MRPETSIKIMVDNDSHCRKDFWGCDFISTPPLLHSLTTSHLLAIVLRRALKMVYAVCSSELIACKFWVCRLRTDIATSWVARYACSIPSCSLKNESGAHSPPETDFLLVSVEKGSSSSDLFFHQLLLAIFRFQAQAGGGGGRGGESCSGEGYLFRCAVCRYFPSWTSLVAAFGVINVASQTRTWNFPAVDRSIDQSID